MREKISIVGLCLIVLASCAFYTELVVWGVEYFIALNDERIFVVRVVLFGVFVFLNVRYCMPSLRKVL